jgi:tRNA 2-thiouridine synthesizing protein A
MAVHELDATGLKCPMPVLRAARALRGLKAGDVLIVTACDAAAPKDFAAFCATVGHRLKASREEQGVYVLEIEVAV